MSYIGPAPNPGQNREVDDISSGFNGGTAAFTLQVNGQNVSPGSSNNIIVSLGGVIQNPGTDYTIAGSTITFTTNPASGLSFFGLVLGQGVDTSQPADASVTAAKLVKPIDLADDEQIRFGTGNDTTFTHSGADFAITNTTGNLNILNNSAGAVQIRHGSETMIKAISDGAVELYHDDTKQCETSANGLAFPSGKGIDFSAQTSSSATGASTSSEVLDHYEEGTWTPTSNVGAITVANAHYVKIGSIVLAQAYVTFPSMSGSAAVELNGYPFATANTSDFHSAAVNSDANLNTQLCGQFVSTQMLFATENNSKANVNQLSSKFVVVSVTYVTH